VPVFAGLKSFVYVQASICTVSPSASWREAHNRIGDVNVPGPVWSGPTCHVVASAADAKIDTAKAKAA